MKCPHCGEKTGRVDNVDSHGVMTESDPLFYITIPPYSACEILWASEEGSEKLDSKILCSGPLRIAVIDD